MPVALAPNFTQINLLWTAWKTLYNSKGGVYQYQDDGSLITVWFYDPPEVYYAVIWDGTVPSGVIASGYSQAQNDTDKSDFNTNWLAGANKRISRTDQFGNPIVNPFDFYSATGNIPGVTISRAQGYVTTSATSGKAIRATTYTPQGTNSQRSFNSTSALDTSAGTGAQKVTINYLDTSFVAHSETVTLNGLTAVNTVGTNIALIESIVVSQVGTLGGNQGTIQVWTATGGTGSVWGSIAASDNQTFWAHHYVPTGATCYILSLTAGATVVAGQTNINRTGNPLSTNLPQLQIGVTIMHVAAGTWDHDYEVPLAVVGPDLIFLVERPVASTASTAVAGFEYIQF